MHYSTHCGPTSAQTYWPSEKRLYYFCVSLWIFIQINNYFKLLALEIEPLTLGLQGQCSTPTPRGLTKTPLLLILFEKIHQCPMGNLFVNTVMNFREHITLVAMLKTRGFWPIALFHFLHLPPCYLSLHSMALATLNKVVWNHDKHCPSHCELNTQWDLQAFLNLRC